MSINPHLHTAIVRKQAAKILALREYGLEVKQIAQRYEVAPGFIEKLLREARLSRAIALSMKPLSQPILR